MHRDSESMNVQGGYQAGAAEPKQAEQGSRLPLPATKSWRPNLLIRARATARMTGREYSIELIRDISNPLNFYGCEARSMRTHVSYGSETRWLFCDWMFYILG
jgi:hypothetical protein